jgi:hypothetical protein
MTITLKRGGTCAECGATLPTGTRAKWYRDGSLYCLGHEDTRPYAERIKAKKERAGRRVEHLEARAERLTGEATRRFDAAHSTLDCIPMGQPILVGHHSEGRHRRDIARAENNMRRGVDAYREAEATADAAKGSAALIDRMERPDVTKRRLERLEAERRVCERGIAAAKKTLETGLGAWGDQVTPEHAQGSLSHYVARLAEFQEQIDYWQAHLEATGAKFPGPADFHVGDIVTARHGRKARVVRVNPKSLSVVYVSHPLIGWEGKFGYEELQVSDTVATEKEAAANV